MEFMRLLSAVVMTSPPPAFLINTGVFLSSNHFTSCIRRGRLLLVVCEFHSYFIMINYNYVLVLIIVYLILRLLRRRRQRRTHKWWIKPWIARRGELGEYARLVAELEAEDRDSFKRYMRMAPEDFMGIQEDITPRIRKRDTRFRMALQPGLKLAATLRYLAVGKSLREQHFTYRLGLTSLSRFIPEVCQAIVDTYADRYMPVPSTEAQWRTIAEDFGRRWNLPHCIGAIDGKHIAINNPAGGGALYYNYKSFYSVVLMAVVDAHYRFIYVNVGAPGAGSDGGVFARTLLREQLENDELDIPAAEPLTEGGPEVPYFLVGDEAFPLKTWLMKPVPRRQLTMNQRIYNYRISRARRVVENAFGIMANKWRCLLYRIALSPEKLPVIVTACCVLHNMLLTRRLRDEGHLFDREDPDHGVIQGQWREDPDNMVPLQARGGNTGTEQAKALRNYLVEYVNSEDGAVPWQQNMI